eukprot:2877839-Rhodomonas_salina.1
MSASLPPSLPPSHVSPILCPTLSPMRSVHIFLAYLPTLSPTPVLIPHYVLRRSQTWSAEPSSACSVIP